MATRSSIVMLTTVSATCARIEEGKDKPINIRIEMSNPSGIFQVDNLFANKIRDSGLEKYIDVEVIVGEERFT